MDTSMEPKKYLLKTVEDFLQIPDDRVDECLREFAVVLRMVNEIEAKSQNSIAEVNTGLKVKILMPYFGWIDNGRSDKYIVIRNGNRYIVTKDEPNA